MALCNRLSLCYERKIVLIRFGNLSTFLSILKKKISKIMLCYAMCEDFDEYSKMA